MKNLNLITRLFLICPLFIFLISSCKKSEEILGVAYGGLFLESVFSGDAPPLLIQVDGDTKDTLSIDKPTTPGNIILKSGEHKVTLVNQSSKEILSETTVQVQTGQTLKLPKFLYTGTATLFDDLEAKPARDSMLVRLVTADPSLPDVMNLEIIVSDFAGTNIVTGIKVTNVRKDRFTDFIQLPNMSKLLPEGTDPTFYYYVIEGYDPADNNKKVMSIDEGNCGYIEVTDENSSFYSFLPNVVLSMGIGPAVNGSTLHSPIPIFIRTVN